MGTISYAPPADLSVERRLSVCREAHLGFWAVGQ